MKNMRLISNNNIKSCRIGYEGTNLNYFISWYENGNIDSYGLMGVSEPNPEISKNETTLLDSLGVIACRTSSWFIKNGKWSYFRMNGKLDRTEFYDNGEKIYIWKYYDDLGNVSKIEYYENGTLVKTILK